MGGITRLNQLPDGSGILSSDDIFLMMDDPSGSAVTKKVSLAALSSIISQDTITPNVQTINNASGTINTNVSLYNVFNINLSGSGTLAAPSNSSDGQRSLWRVKRTNGQVLTIHSNFRIINSGVIDNTDHTTTFIDGVYDSVANRWDSIIYSNLPAIAPSAPSGVTGTGGDSLVNLSWSAPADDGGNAIIDYIIQYSANSGTSWSTFNDGIGTSTSVSVTGLVNDTSYIFRVAAQNNIDVGPYSNPSSGIMPTAISYTIYLNMNSSPFVDSIDTERTISSNSIAILDTTNKQVGAGSLSVDQNGYLYTTDTADIDLTGDFTIDFWMYPSGIPSVGYGIVMTTSLNTTANGIFISWDQISSESINVGVAATSDIVNTSTGTAPIDTWSHIVITRSGTAIKIFVNDIQQASGTSSYAFQCPQLNIGEGDNVGAGAGFIGNIDEFKIISGSAIEP
jgi:hypothetical protein